jgi:hypothetical protein
MEEAAHEALSREDEAWLRDHQHTKLLDPRVRLEGIYNNISL